MFVGSPKSKSGNTVPWEMMGSPSLGALKQKLDDHLTVDHLTPLLILQDVGTDDSTVQDTFQL